MRRILVCARRSTSTTWSANSEKDGLCGILYPRTRPADLAVIPQLEHPPLGAGCRADRRRGRGRAATCPLDPNLHGRRRAIPAAVLPIVPRAYSGSSWRTAARLKVIARLMTEKLGSRSRRVGGGFGRLIVTYGRVSLFVAIFVIVPMAQGLFRTADIPLRLMPVAPAP